MCRPKGKSVSERDIYMCLIGGELEMYWPYLIVAFVVWLATHVWYSYKCEYLEDLAMKKQSEAFEHWAAKNRKLSAENESLRMGTAYKTDLMLESDDE